MTASDANRILDNFNAIRRSRIPTDAESDLALKAVRALKAHMETKPMRKPAPKFRNSVQKPAPQTIADLRREFGDERRNPALWDTLPDPLQRHWARAKQSAGERLSEVERRAYNQPGVERRVTHNADLKVVTR